MRHGFSLLETILATALLGAVMLLLFNLYPASAMAIRQSQEQLVADSIALSIFEECHAQPFSELPVGKTTRAPVQGFYPEVEVFAAGDPEMLKGVRVVLSWQSLRGPRQGSYEMILANLQR